MKIKNILLGTLMATTAVVSLASCDDKNIGTTPEPEPTPVVEKFTATFKQDGTTLKVYTLDKGTQISYTAVTPTKDADANYTYTFKGWDYTNDGVVDSLPTISADIVFEAIFERTEKVVASHTVQVVDRGNVIYTNSVKEGTALNLNVASPSNYEDETYTYTFAGWTYNGTLVTSLSGYTMGTSDMTFTAYYNRTEKSQGQGGQGEQGGNDQTEEFIVSFYNGTELYETKTTKGGYVSNVSISKDGYKFLGWTDASGNVVNVESTVFSSNTALYASWERVIEQGTTNVYSTRVKHAFTDYDRPFTRTSLIKDWFNETTEIYYMVEEYVPDTSYTRTIYKNATSPKEISDDKIVETLTVTASNHTYTFNDTSYDYSSYFSTFREMFNHLWRRDLSEGTEFIAFNNDEDTSYSEKFNNPFCKKVSEFANLIEAKINDERDNFDLSPEYVEYQKGNRRYYYYEDEEENCFECSYLGSTLGIYYYSYSIGTVYNDVN